MRRMLRVIASGARALDVGCGSGILTELLARSGFRVQAIDVSEQAVAVTRERLAGYPVEVACSDLLSFSGGPYDLIMLSEVLEHCEDDRAVLQRVRDLLAPGGRLLLTVPANPALWSDLDSGAGHLRRYRRRELAKLVTDAGLEVQQLVAWGFPFCRMIYAAEVRLTRRRGKQVIDRIGGGRGGRLMRLLVPALRGMSRAEAWLSPLDAGIGYLVLAARPERAA